MTKPVGRSWEYVFSTSLPERIDSLAEILRKLLRSFRHQMNKRAQLTKAPSFGLATRQVKILERSLNDTKDYKAALSTGQKEASRLFVPSIGEAMAGGYASCVGESGEKTSPRRIAWILTTYQASAATSA
jgi:hypothetical protein